MEYLLFVVVQLMEFTVFKQLKKSLQTIRTYISTLYQNLKKKTFTFDIIVLYI